ncbi:MAG: helix-turn-helix domain-containing protein [Gammaproteobacteria bacterium]|jgi:AraC-like DNA-binding protein
MTYFTLITSGFSIVSAALLFFAYVVFFKNLNKSWLAVSSCALLLLTLSALQVSHYEFLLTGVDLFARASYRFWLILAPPMFYIFSRAILLPGAKNGPLLLLHLTPLLFNFIPRYEVTIVMVFVVGTGYAIWLAYLIYSLRPRGERFKVEMFFFGFFALLAIFVLLMGILVPYVDNDYFYYFYANSIALAFILIVTSFIIFPELLNDIAAMATLSYASSTLKGVDVDDSLRRLNDLMAVEKLYQNEKLNLSMVADAMDLTSHQLSELINVHFGKSFSRYVREQRIEAARSLLASQPDASILAISLETGFKSQSNFYAAFKEITGQSPGDYRKTQSRMS